MVKYVLISGKLTLPGVILLSTSAREMCDHGWNSWCDSGILAAVSSELSKVAAACGRLQLVVSLIAV